MARLIVLMPLVMAVSACGSGGTATPAPATQTETAAETGADPETATEEMAATPATATASGTTAPDGNWLIGRWVPVDPACTTYQEVSFTADSFAVVDGPAGWNPSAHTTPVSYTVSAEEAWMQASGNSFRRFPIDANHFKDDDIKACVWQRAS